MKRIALFCALVGSASVFALTDEQLVERFKINEDKIKTMEMLRPIGHDFHIDIAASISDGFQDILDEAETANATGAGAVTAAEAFLQRFNLTEHSINAGLALGFPLPSFRAWGAKVIPNFRASGRLGVHMSIEAEAITADNVLSLINEDLPAEVDAALQSRAASGGFTAGQDMIQGGSGICGNELSAAHIVCTDSSFANKFIFPDASVPNIFNLVKADVKAGMYSNIEIDENWYGAFNLYALARTDLLFRISQEQIAKSDDLIDTGDNANTEINLMTDLKVGYKKSNYMVDFGLEEIKIATVSDRDEGSKEQAYGTDMLIRLHGQFIFDASFARINPFVGIHKRSGYGISDGYYLGSDFTFFGSGERFGLRARTMIDNQHLTLSPRFSLGLLFLEAYLKSPIKDTTDGGVEIPSFYGVNLRIAI